MDIDAIYKEVEAALGKVNSLQEAQAFRAKYLGRKGLILGLTSRIPGLPEGERAAFGRQVNALKQKISLLIDEKEKAFSSPADRQALQGLDPGLPGVAHQLGRLHPLTRTIGQICEIFTRMGFAIVEGPEIENEHNNFTGLNIPLEHPSRDAFDTFYIKPLANSAHKLLLRSHTSPAQIRVMQKRKPPLAVVVPGVVYRPDAVDASHLFMFHQIEGFMVDEGVNFSHLKGALEIFAREVFGQGIRMRFRPHFFPFTEPSAEVDISCIICTREQSTENRLQKKRCSVCGGKRWLEILGAGMIHPNVFRQVGYDPKRYTGFAFGLGVERIAMLKYGIDDIRLFFENDLRFLRQF